MRTQLVVLAASAALAFAVSAQSVKEPWALTLEERIALRTDPVKAQERVRKARGPGAASGSSNRIYDDFDGKSHPELFLPHQVFRSLMNLTFLAPETSAYRTRQALMPEVKSHGLPPDFWERLRAVSSVYLSDWRATEDLGKSLQKQSGAARSRTEQHLKLKQMDECRSRAAALAAARAEFGRERFDRFLYEVIAVHMFHVADELPRAENLRLIERGCR